AADRKGDVERRVDDDTGGADLAFVADPTLVGHDPGGAQRGAEGSGDGGQLLEAGGVGEASAPGDDAFGLAEIHARGISGQQIELLEVDTVVQQLDVNPRDFGRLAQLVAGRRLHTAHAGYKSGDVALGRLDIFDREPSPTAERKPAVVHLDRSGEQWPVERVSKAGREVAPVR